MAAAHRIETFKPSRDHPATPGGHRHPLLLVAHCGTSRGNDRKLEIHVILGKYATHKRTKVKAWLAKHKHVHSVISSSSAWRSTSVDELLAAITAFIERRNTEPKGFMWTGPVKHSRENDATANETLRALQQ